MGAMQTGEYGRNQTGWFRPESRTLSGLSGGNDWHLGRPKADAPTVRVVFSKSFSGESREAKHTAALSVSKLANQLVTTVSAPDVVARHTCRSPVGRQVMMVAVVGTSSLISLQFGHQQ